MDVSGRILVEQKAENFDRNWVSNFPGQVFIISETNELGEVNVTREFINL